MTTKKFLSGKDIVEETGLSLSAAYNVIRQLNNELEAKGYLIIRGKVINTYFYERFFGKDSSVYANIQRH